MMGMGMGNCESCGFDHETETGRAIAWHAEADPIGHEIACAAEESAKRDETAERDLGVPAFDPGVVINCLDDERLANAREYLLKARDAYVEAVKSTLSEIRRVAKRDRDDEFLASLDEHEATYASTLSHQALTAK